MTTLIDTSGKLTAEGKELAAWLQRQYQARVDLGHDPMALRGAESLTSYWAVVVVNSQATAEEFFAEYPEMSADLWQRFMDALPDDDPRAAQQKADDAEGKLQRSTNDAAFQAELARLHKTALLKRAAGESIHMTKHDALFFYLEGRINSPGGLPASSAALAYVRFFGLNAYIEGVVTLEMYFATAEMSALWQHYSEADATERAECVARGRKLYTYDLQAASTPDGLLAEQKRVAANRSRLSTRMLEVKNGAEVAAEPEAAPSDLDALRRRLNEAATPDELRRMMHLLNAAAQS